MMPDRFHIEQALFGYHEGHNLVAASTRLVPRVRQFLANVTDGSGPEKFDGFEATYTGLPVPETDYYALFCTWPAPEMPRPGCVWSHVLLIDLTDLARIPDLSVLREFCHRPTSPLAVSGYKETLREFLSADSVIPLGADDADRAALLLPTLYGNPDSGVVILDDQSHCWETPIFAIWSQQWPRLRRNFAFSTGSLGDRRSTGVTFDLQIAPLGSQRLWRRIDTKKQPTIILQSSHQKDLARNTSWAKPVLDDLRAGNGGMLRKFLFSYGSEAEYPRSAFVKLVEYFIGPPPDDDDDPSSKLVKLAQSFPQPSEALSLKRDQLAAIADSTTTLDLGPSLAVTYFLLQTQDAHAFDRVAFDFHSHLTRLWKYKRADVVALLGGVTDGERAEAFLQALAASLSPEDVPTLWHEQPAATQRLLAYQPNLAADASAWAMPEAGQRALWNSLRAITIDQQIWSLTCGAMLRARCAFAEQETVSLAGSSLMGGITANWLQAKNFHLPSASWREALRPPLANALGDRQLESALLALAVWTLPPLKARSLSGCRSDVQNLARHGIASVPEPLVLHTLFWLTALGLQTAGEAGLTLLGKTFFLVYDTVARSQYPGEAWELLDPILPQLLMGLDWDRCRRLRRALRHWLEQNSDFGDALSDLAPTPEHARLVQNLR